MRLIEKATKRELKEGDEVDLRRGAYRISGLDPKNGIVFLIDCEADRAPFALRPAALGCEFRT